VKKKVKTQRALSLSFCFGFVLQRISVLVVVTSTQKVFFGECSLELRAFDQQKFGFKKMNSHGRVMVLSLFSLLF